MPRAEGSRLFVLVVVVIVIAHFALTNVGYLFLNSFGDFDAYYTAALVFRDGRNPYEPRQLFARENENADFLAAGRRAGTVHSHGDYEHVHPFIYPPMLGFLVMPLATFSNDVAEGLWLVLNVGLVAASIAVLAATVGLAPGVSLALGVVLVLRFEALDSTLALGQVNVVVSFLVFAAVALFCAGRATALSALLLALSIAIKLQPVVFLGYALLVRRVRYVALCLAFLVALHVPIVLWVGPEPFRTFFGSLMPQLGAGTAININQSLPGLILRVGGVLGLAPDAPALLWVSRLAGVGVLAATVWLMRIKDGDHRYNLSLVAIALLVIAPITWSSHLLFLYLPLFYVLKALEDGAVRSPGLVVTFVVAYVLAGVVPQVFYDNQRLSGLLTVFASVRLYGMLLLMYCVWRAGGRVPVPSVAVAPATA